MDFWIPAGIVVVFIIIISIYSNPKRRYKNSGSPVTKNQCVIFAARKSAKHTWPFFILFGLFWLLGIGLWTDILSGGTFQSNVSFISTSEQFGMLIVGFTTLVLIIMILLVRAKGSWYGISDQGLLMSINGYKTFLKYTYMESLSKISDSEAETLLTGLHKNAATFFNMPQNRITAGLSENDLIRFMSVPAISTDIRVDGIPIPGRVRTSGDFVCLHMKDGGIFLMTPLDVDGYITAAQQYLQQANLSTPRENVSV